MSTLVVARFDSVPSARSAAHALIADGFREDAVSMFYGDPPNAGRDGPLRVGPDLRTRTGRYGAVASVAALAMLGALLGVVATLLLGHEGTLALVVGASSGAYVGALAGALWVVAGLRRAQEAYGAGGVLGRVILVAVQAHPDDAEAAATLLRDAGGVRVDAARGRWRAGRWTELDPVRRTVPPPQAAHRTQWQP
ncbi:hypothetical protein [Bordetella sp. 2513F-2]